MRALVICAGGGIGDVLLATPVMRALRGRYDSVIALTAKSQQAVLAANPDLAEVWADDEPFKVTAARIRAAKIDASVVTWASLRAAALPVAGGVPIRVGQTGRIYSPLFTHRVPVRSEAGDRATHWTQILLDYARALGCDTLDAKPTFTVQDGDRIEAARVLLAQGIGEPYVILHPTRAIAAARGRWPVEGLATLARRMTREYGVPVLVSGGEGDRPIAERIAELADAQSIAGTTTLGGFAALAQGARAVVAVDSGPMHVAAAVGAPTVGIFALQSDQPDRWAPLGPRTAVVRPSYPCPPQHRKETCPDFACMRELDVARVLAALDGLLGAQREPRR